MIDAWFNEGLKLEQGETIFFQVPTTDDQKAMVTALNRIKKQRMQSNLEEAMQIYIDSGVKNSKYFVYLTRVKATPFVGVKRDSSGKLSKISIEESTTRRRRIALMLRDGYDKEKISEEIGGLSASELKEFFTDY
jgi:hypothetical protein